MHARTFRIGVYDHTIQVRVYAVGEKLPGGDGDVLALTDTTASGRVRIHVRPYTPLATIAHEATHAALRVLWHRGLVISPDSEEALAYLVGHITGLVQDAQRSARAVYRAVC